MTKEINRKLDNIESIWFVEKAYFVGSVRVNYFYDYSATLIIVPRYGYDIMRFEVDKCPIEQELDYNGAVNKAIRYLTPFRVLYLNVKTFFAGLKYML